MLSNFITNVLPQGALGLVGGHLRLGWSKRDRDRAVLQAYTDSLSSSIRGDTGAKFRKKAC